MIVKILFSLFIVTIGALFVIYANKLYEIIGPIPWAEQHLGTEGGSRLMYKLIGIALCIIGFMLMTGMLESVLIWFIRILFPGFVPNQNPAAWITYTIFQFPIIFGLLAQLARAPHLQWGGRGFKSLTVHFTIIHEREIASCDRRKLKIR